MIVGLLRLMRLYYSVPMAGGFAVIVAFLTAGDVYPIRCQLMLSCLSLFCTISASYVLNDVFDLPTDKINFPNRMLVKGKVTMKSASTP